MAQVDAIVQWADQRLQAATFQDVAVNGLQVAGRADVVRLAVAVSTSQRTLNAALAWGADALLVHHGLLWGSRSGPITGLFAERLRLLLANDINLIGYHLPLDGHPEIGNCALLARAAGYESAGRFALVGGEPLGVVGTRRAPHSLGELLAVMAEITGREPLAVGAVEDAPPLERVGFLTGSGYSALDEALEAGCDALVTGDIREPTMAEAREMGVVVVAAGHEATERLGVQALAAEIAAQFGVETRFFADPNPV
ncbi:MAG: Nif3-like dinuclear metal center hexameric protein [Thermomicrobiales bacterium]|nr:Nif3-like dinuclear metal center hexameric protein [Thermomicrobiales bacterium]